MDRKVGPWFVAFVFSLTTIGYGQATTGSFLGTVTTAPARHCPEQLSLSKTRTQVFPAQSRAMRRDVMLPAH